MFEHSLYEAEPVATPTEEGDLFHNYEIKNWDLSKRIYQILGVSAFFNILALLVFSTTSVLTMKGCDSPLVGNVCQVLDTIYVGSKLFGTDREYVDAVYEKTELGDADVTFVDVSGDTPPLSYPEGYFQIANPEQFQAMVEQANNPTLDPGFIAPGIPITTPSTGNSIIDTPQKLPKTNPNPIAGELPGGFGDAGSNPTTRKGRRGGRVQPDDDDTAKAEPTPKPTVEPEPTPKPEDAKPDKNGVYINKRPLTDKAKDTIAKVDANQVKLEAPFKVSVVGTLGLAKDGTTIVLKNPKPIPPPKGVKNDPAMEKLVQDWILAIGDSGWFGYIDKLDDKKKIKAKKVFITIEQNDANFVATIKAEQPDENTAKSASSGLNVIIGFARESTDDYELEFLKSAASTSEGNYLVLNVNMPKPRVQEMIKKKLADTKKASEQQNNNPSGGIANNSAKNSIE